MESSGEDTKRSKPTGDIPTAAPDLTPSANTARMHAQAAAVHIPFLNVEHLMPPKLPSHGEMEGIILTLRKKALVEEYFGDS